MHLLSNFWAIRSSLLAAVIFVAVALSGCSTGQSANGETGNNAANEQNPVFTVTTARVEARQVPSYIQATGTLVADETSDIAPKVAGKVSNVSVNVGDFVGQGAVVARIDDKDARLQLAEAQAAVKQAVAGVRQAEARLGLEPNGRFNASAIPEVQTANANYQQTIAELRQAEANEQRYRELVETGDVPMMTYEQHRTQRDTARARVAAAKQQLDAAVNTARQSNQAIRSAEAGVEAARAQVATAEQALADTVIRAPFAGFVSARPVAVGEFVNTATIVATILRTNPITAELQVSEADVPGVVVGRGVSISVDAYPDRSFAGTVRAVNPAVEATSRSAIVEASIDNADNALRTGMFASGRILKEGGGAGVFVPKTAVYNDQSTQSYRAFVIVDGVAKLRILQLGTEEGGFYQILSGLNPDEIVANSNLEQLYEGAKVIAQ